MFRGPVPNYFLCANFRFKLFFVLSLAHPSANVAYNLFPVISVVPVVVPHHFENLVPDPHQIKIRIRIN